MSASALRTGCAACSASRACRTGTLGTRDSASSEPTIASAATVKAADGATHPITAPATAGAERLPDGGAHHPLEAVDRHQVLLGDQGGQHRRVRRVVERHRHADQERDHAEQDDVGGVGPGQRGDHRHPEGLDAGHREQDPLLRQPVGDHAGQQRRHHHPDGAGPGDQGELGGAAAEPEDLPDQADHPDALGEGTEGDGRGEPPVGGGAEGGQRPGQAPTGRLVADGVEDLVDEGVGHGGVVLLRGAAERPIWALCTLCRGASPVPTLALPTPRVTSMRALQVITPTGPADVEVREVAEPTAGPGQVLVEVHSVGVSFPDLLLSKGEYQLKPEPPFTLGVDLAGTVAALGEGVEGLTVGQRVAGVLPHGGAAELAVVPADFVFPLPDETSYDEGAALPMNYLTAQFALDERARPPAR